MNYDVQPAGDQPEPTAIHPIRGHLLSMTYAASGIAEQATLADELAPPDTTQAPQNSCSRPDCDYARLVRTRSRPIILSDLLLFLTAIIGAWQIWSGS